MNPQNPIMSMFVQLCTEVIRNFVGILLLLLGVFVIVLGAHWHMNDLIVLGTATLIPGALLALQGKRGQDAPPPGGTERIVETAATPPATPQQASNASQPASQK